MEIEIDSDRAFDALDDLKAQERDAHRLWYCLNDGSRIPTVAELKEHYEKLKDVHSRFEKLLREGLNAV